MPKVKDCPFCYVDRETIAENKHALAIADLFPVSVGHSLIIPKIHMESVFELLSPVYAACFNLVRLRQRASVFYRYRSDSIAQSVGMPTCHAMRVCRTWLPQGLRIQGISVHVKRGLMYRV